MTQFHITVNHSVKKIAEKNENSLGAYEQIQRKLNLMKKPQN